MMKCLCQLVILAGLVVTSVGCSDGPGDTPEIGHIEGTVSLNGEPVAHANIMYKPLEGGRVSNGVSDADGHYVIYYKANVPGAKVGKHVVKVWTAADEVGTPGTEDYQPAIKETIPEKYLGSDSELKVDIEPGHNTIPLDLTS